MDKFTSRILSVYEKNQLLKYSLKEAELLTKGELPVEYLTGYVNFKNLEIKVNQNVLIPRIETEELVDLLTKFVATLKKNFSYLELGTGSGAISLAIFDFLKRKSKLASIKNFVLTDISDAALKLARENFMLIFDQDSFKKVTFSKSDLLSTVKINEKFDLIVANLPYIPSAKIAELEPSVKDFEPLLALDGGKTGFELIAKMLQEVLDKDVLLSEGKIFLEVDETHTLDFIKSNFPSIYEKFLIEEIKDQFGRQRFLILQRR